MSKQGRAPGRPHAGRRARFAGRASLALICACLAGLALAAAASARTVNLIVYSGDYLDGSGSAYNYKFGSGYGILELAIHQSDGHLLAYDHGYIDPEGDGTSTQGIISQWDSNGNRVDFGSTNSNLLVGVGGYWPGAIAVDNSANATNGTIYALGDSNPLHAWTATGTELGGNFPISDFGGEDCGMATDPQGDIWVANYSTSKLIEFNSGGNPTGTQVSLSFNPCALAIDSAGNFYVAAWNGATYKYDSSGTFVSQIDPGSTERIGIDPSNNDVYVNHGNVVNVYNSSGTQINSFGQADPDHGFAGLSNATGIAINGTTHDIYVSNGQYYAGNYHIEIFRSTGDITIPDVTTGAPTDITPTSATIHGVVNADGVQTTNCHFDWGTNTNYTNGSVPCDSSVFDGTDDHPVSATLSPLTPGTTYHYRVVASNANGVRSIGSDQSFKPEGPPEISGETVSNVNTDNATLSADIDPSGDATDYHFEIGTDTGYGINLPDPPGQLSSVSEVAHVTQTVGATLATRLQPDTTYHYRVVAHNAQDTTYGGDHTFHTFPGTSAGPDTCDNSHERQQTGADLLADCRAYELVSAANAGGYDVQSDVIVGQNVLPAYPNAPDRVLYSLHYGKVPNVGGSPTNYGLDPYVASRGASGWTTSYVGLPADGMATTSIFGSPLAAADRDLTAFAFSGTGLCDPCFADGSKGIPVRLPNGDLVQGMKGDLDPGPSAQQAGYVGRRMSGDGSHLVFGSTSKFEPAGNDNGDVTIYDRDLNTGQTRVASRTTSGATMTGSGIGELDISRDGSRILIGKAVSTDAFGNTYWHLYMDTGGSGTVDVTPGTSTGVLYAGMTRDGSKVFFSTRDQLGSSGDSDSSADLYRADVSAGSASLTRISTGSGAGNTDNCDPVANHDGPHWNNRDGAKNCDVVVFPGGAGVSASNGTAYFLSPEQLDGDGTADAPNLYAVQPGGSPRFVATLEADSPMLHDATFDNEARGSGDFQTTPDGGFAVFVSRLPLTDYPNAGHSEIYRYDAAADELTCASCAPTRATATGDVTLSGNGLNLSDDGRVFFTSPEQLVLRDTNGKRDAYEWSGGKIELISTGTDPADSGLLSVSADGVNAYFFTRAKLVATDENGTAMKIYDARAGGGFAHNPTPPPCQASDECHGPGTVAPAPPPIGTFRGTGGNATESAKPRRKKCGKHKVRRHGKCVKRKKRHRRHHRRHHRKHHRHSTRSHG